MIDVDCHDTMAVMVVHAHSEFQSSAEAVFDQGVATGAFPAELTFSDVVESPDIEALLLRLAHGVGSPCTLETAMNRALLLAFLSVLRGGGPFGAIIVKHNHWVSHGVNQVALTNDPTHHGEVAAVRRAMGAGQADVCSGATLVTSTAPCPMCFALALSVGISTIAYCTTDEDAHDHGGFCDHVLWDEVAQKERPNDDCVTLFSCHGHHMMPDPAGEPLTTVLQRYCKSHGFEPQGLLFRCDDAPIALRLFDYTALRWAGVVLPQHVGVVLPDDQACRRVPMQTHVGIGRLIFKWYKDHGVAYGQRS